MPPYTLFASSFVRKLPLKDFVSGLILKINPFQVAKKPSQVVVKQRKPILLKSELKKKHNYKHIFFLKFVKNF